MNIPPLQPDKVTEESAPPPREADACMDCGTVLEGKFCHSCGQRKQRRVASLFQLAGELINGIFNLESRLWRTLWPLFARPGVLTKAFVEGKRQRYLPPIRLYLISSIVFFVLVSMSPRSFLGEVSDLINFKMGGSTSIFERGLDTPINTESARALINAINEANAEKGGPLIVTSDDIDEEGLLTIDVNPTVDDETDDIPSVSLDQRVVLGADDLLPEDNSQSDDSSTADPDSQSPDVDNQDSPGEMDAQAGETAGVEGEPDTDTESGDDLEDFEVVTNCEEIRDQEYSSGFEFLRTPAYRFCLSVSTWRGLLAFMGELIDNLPKTLLLLLPLMAVVNKLLYLFAGRYYVEHLLFYVHNYSFLLLFAILLIGIVKLGDYFGVGLSGLAWTIGFLYTIYYFIKSMRVVYGQGRIFTFIKWLLINTLFIILLTVVILFFTLATAAVHGI